MSCVLSTAHSARRFSMSLIGGLVILGVVTLPLRAQEPDANAAQRWCIAHSGEQPDCNYEDLLVCSVKAFGTGGFCVKAEPPAPVAATAEPAPQPKRRDRPRRKLATAPNDKLFKEFMRWKEAGGK